ncbi:hypothetical protein BJV74DRAFT_822657 [Russula compacta]|nr:hypothetical protein BJV74DRAFT_822657 [Russula compacta]
MLAIFSMIFAITAFVITHYVLRRRHHERHVDASDEANFDNTRDPDAKVAPTPPPDEEPASSSASSLPSNTHSEPNSAPVAAPSQADSPTASTGLFRPRIPLVHTASGLGSHNVSSSSEPVPVAASSATSLPSVAQASVPSVPYIPSREDVIASRGILLHLLPLELVDEILHAAEYYPRHTSVLPAHHFDDPLTVRDGRRQVVLTPPIQHPESISRILIQTESHDQGWSSYPQDRGTYRNSWTWLDLGVIRGTPENDPAPDWRIYTNMHASDTWQNTEVDLDRENETVVALKPGDSLAIWAEARFPGWMNNVRSAKIEVIYAI